MTPDAERSPVTPGAGRSPVTPDAERSPLAPGAAAGSSVVALDAAATPAAPSDVRAAGPVADADRLPLLDVLRGFALLGILAVNMGGFAHPMSVLASAKLPVHTPLDAAADGLVVFFAAGKFYALFSLLFGLGQALQLERGHARGADLTGRLVRRQLVLLGIGLFHAVVIWPGDILTLYALLGLLLLAFRGVRPGFLLGWALGLVGLTAVALVGAVGLLALVRASPAGAALDAPLKEAADETAAFIAEAYAAYRSTSFGAILTMHVREYLMSGKALFFIVPGVLAMFLTGLFLARKRWLFEADRHRRTWWKVLAVCLPLGLAFNALMALGHHRMTSAFDLSGWLVAYMAGFVVGGPALCLAYVAAPALLWGDGAGRSRLLRPVAAAGRMALSNYLLQSLVWTTVFNGYGLGLMGQVGVAAATGLAVGFWLLQLALSTWWLSRYRFGPAEWVWRSLTWGARQPMRRRPA